MWENKNLPTGLFEFECGINNKQQCVIIDYIVHLSKSTEYDISICTNSEVIINRIGRHIAEDNIDNEQISIFLHNKDKIHKCKFTENGIITNWISGFFEGDNLLK